MILPTLLLTLTFTAVSIFAVETEADGPLEIGGTPPEWELSSWLGGKPVTLKELRGKVVLIRFWTAPGCPYCRATAPALNAFYEQYHNAGLEVFGIYHHKSPQPLTEDNVKLHASQFGFKFPVAIDADWRTLKRWWLAGDAKDKWTSVSFLLDRKGAVRYIHPGGQYVKGDGKYEELEQKVVELLKQE